MAFHPEFLSGNGHDERLLQQEHRKFDGAFVVRPEVGQAVERAVGLGDVDAGKSAQFLHHDVAVVFHRQPQVLDDVLQAQESALCRRLEDNGSGRRHLSLDVRHHAGEFLVRDCPADAEARHAVELRDAVDEDDHRALDILRRVAIRVRRPHSVEDQLVINVVDNKIDPLGLTEINDVVNELIGVHDPGRIVGTVDDNGAGIGADDSLDILYPRVKRAVLRRHDNRNAEHHPHHFGIADPVGSEDDHLVLRVNDRIENVVHGLLGAGRDDDVFRGDDTVVILFGVMDDCFFEARRAIGRSVFNISGDKLRRRTENRIDRGLILGLSRSEMNHGFAFFAEKPRFFIEFQRRRLGDRLCELT